REQEKGRMTIKRQCPQLNTTLNLTHTHKHTTQECKRFPPNTLSEFTLLNISDVIHSKDTQEAGCCQELQYACVSHSHRQTLHYTTCSFLYSLNPAGEGNRSTPSVSHTHTHTHTHIHTDTGPGCTH